MNTIYLTQAEQRLFQALPEKLRSFWTVSPEKIGYEESQAKQRVRCKFMKLSPALKKGMDQIGAISSQESFEKWAASIDISKLTDNDLKEVFYALGPVSIGRMLEQMIPGAVSGDDVEAVAAIAAIRHVIFTPL
jgi:hypothetical protein